MFLWIKIQLSLAFFIKIAFLEVIKIFALYYIITSQELIFNEYKRKNKACSARETCKGNIKKCFFNSYETLFVNSRQKQYDIMIHKYAKALRGKKKCLKTGFPNFSKHIFNRLRKRTICRKDLKKILIFKLFLMKNIICWNYSSLNVLHIFPLLSFAIYHLEPTSILNLIVVPTINYYPGVSFPKWKIIWFLQQFGICH